MRDVEENLSRRIGRLVYGKRTTENSSLETEASSKTAVMVLSFLNVFHTVLSLVSGTVLSGGI